MQPYRALQERLVSNNDQVWKDEQVQAWAKAQQQAPKRGALSETRKHYMEQILGPDWIQQNKPWEKPVLQVPFRARI